jgi:hypothetical protein
MKISKWTIMAFLPANITIIISSIVVYLYTKHVFTTIGVVILLELLNLTLAYFYNRKWINEDRQNNKIRI